MTVEEFILKMKQGESVLVDERNICKIKVRNLLCPLYLDKDTIVVSYIETGGDKIRQFEKSRVGIINKKSDYLYVFDIGDTHYLDSKMDDDDFKKLFSINLNNDIEELESNHIRLMSQQKEFVYSILATLRGERAAKDNPQCLSHKVVNDNWDNSSILGVALGVNNFVYRYENMNRENENIFVLGFLKEGYDFLKKYETDYNIHIVHQYESLCEKYKDVKNNVEYFIGKEIKRCMKDKSSVYIETTDGKRKGKINKCNKESSLYFDSNQVIGSFEGQKSWEVLSINCKDIQSLLFRNKEIFNREKELERLTGNEFQNGINSMIEFLNQGDNYKRFNNIKKEDLGLGDLVYTNSEHFGIAIGQDEVYLDDGNTCNISECCISVTEKEMTNDLKIMADCIMQDYTRERNQRMR